MRYLVQLLNFWCFMRTVFLLVKDLPIQSRVNFNRLVWLL